MTVSPDAAAGIAGHVAQSSRRDKLRFPPPDADAMATVLPPPLPHHAAAARFTTLLLLQSPPYAGSLQSVVVLMGSRFLRPAQQLLHEVCAALPPESTTVEGAAATVGSSPSPSSSSLSGAVDTDAPLHCEGSARRGREVFREEKAKLLHLQEEVCNRYKQYYQQMETVVSSFESVPGLSCSTPYASSSIEAISRHFRRIRRMISRQMQYISRLLAEELLSPPSSSSGDKVMTVMEKSQQPAAPAVLKRPRGHPHPKRAISVLRAWLFNNFLHPYPTDEDKQMLATCTGLSPKQVSSWFSNARSRLWMPMVEELHNLSTLPAAGSTPSHFGVTMPSSSSHTAHALPPPVAVAMAGGQHQMLEQCREHAAPAMGAHEAAGSCQGQAGTVLLT